MSGYNAHLTVDLAHSIAATATTQANVPDYYRIVDSIAQDGEAIITDTKATYGADLGPLWHFYFLGEGLDQLVGQGVATGLMLRAADDGCNALTLANGFALQNPQSKDAAETEIQALWNTAGTAFDALASAGGL